MARTPKRARHDVSACENQAPFAVPTSTRYEAIVERRLLNQCITGTVRRRPEDVVAWLGAVQAQEYPAARWGLAQRMRDGARDDAIARAVDEGRLLRTHVMRPTWHFVTPRDIRWMLELTAPRVHRVMSTYMRRAGLDAATTTRGMSIIERALGAGRCLRRTALGTRLARDGLALKGMPLALLTMCAELDGIICSGPYDGRHLTYALVAERAPGARRLSRDEALAELARRYFSSHGPATIRDFVWWSGLTTADAKRGLDMNKAAREDVEGTSYWTIGHAPRAGRPGRVHLLPVYDEYLVAYRDRQAVPHGTAVMRTAARGSVTFQHAVVIGGQVAGTWRAVRKGDGLTVEVTGMRRLTGAERRELIDEADRYGRFLGTTVTVSTAS
jgi:hypothetical protein